MFVARIRYTVVNRLRVNNIICPKEKAKIKREQNMKVCIVTTCFMGGLDFSDFFCEVGLYSDEMVDSCKSMSGRIWRPVLSFLTF